MPFTLKPERAIGIDVERIDYLREHVDTGERWVLNFGPQHPATHTTLRLVLELEGETVVDLWAGFMDAERTQPWQRDTLANVYSTTKGITAIAAELGVSPSVLTSWVEMVEAEEKTGLTPDELEELKQRARELEAEVVVTEDELPLTEASPLRPASPYAASKVAADYLGLQAHLGQGLGVIRVHVRDGAGLRRDHLVGAGDVGEGAEPSGLDA